MNVRKDDGEIGWCRKTELNSMRGVKAPGSR